MSCEIERYELFEGAANTLAIEYLPCNGLTPSVDPLGYTLKFVNTLITGNEVTAEIVKNSDNKDVIYIEFDISSLNLPIGDHKVSIYSNSTTVQSRYWQEEILIVVQDAYHNN